MLLVLKSFCFAHVSRLENVCCCMINEVIIGENHWGSNPGAYLITNFLPSVSLPFPTLTLHHFSRLIPQQEYRVCVGKNQTFVFRQSISSLILIGNKKPMVVVAVNISYIAYQRLEIFKNPSYQLPNQFFVFPGKPCQKLRS